MKLVYLDAYLKAWQIHCGGSTDSAQAMIAASDPTIRYSDINLADPFVGPTGILAMCRLASGILPGAFMDIRDRLGVDRTWATQWELRGNHGKNNVPYRIPGVSWGTLADDGRVTSQLDFWNPSHFEQQVGVPLFPGA
jgi:hypothetical protein